jgi:hypothetical protein
MTIDEARLSAHQKAMRDDPTYRAGYEAFLQDRQRRKEERTVRRRRRHVLLNGWLWCRLPMPRVFLHGPRWWRFMVEGSKTDYDFAEDVRELVLDRIRFDVVAEWTDPREWLSR